jgi:hypothetical protein
MRITCILIDVFIFCGFFIIFFFNFLINGNLDLIDYQTYTSSLTKNWKNTPIIDIQPTMRDCPDNYSFLVYDLWPGTVNGCNCKGNKLSIGKCYKNDVGCKDVPSIGPYPISSWRNIKVCVKRLNLTSYFSLNISVLDENCPENFRSCGVIDTLGNSLCTLKTEECPINDIQILGYDEELPIGYRSIRLDEFNLTMAYGNQGPKGKIVIDFKISENRPCADPYFFNRVEKPYFLSSTNNRDKCIAGYDSNLLDYSYEFIDSSSLFDIYSKNNIFNITRNLPNFYFSSRTKTINLYYRNYIGLKKSCFDQIKNNNLYKRLRTGLYYINSRSLSLSSFYAGIFLYVIVIWCISITVFHFYRILVRFVLLEFIATKCISIVIEGLFYLNLMIISILYIVFVSNIKSVWDANNELRDYLNCGDSFFNEAVASFMQIFDKIYFYSIINMVISISILIIPLSTIAIIFCINKKNKCNYTNGSLRNLYRKLFRKDFSPPKTNEKQVKRNKTKVISINCDYNSDVMRETNLDDVQRKNQINLNKKECIETEMDVESKMPISPNKVGKKCIDKNKLTY